MTVIPLLDLRPAAEPDGRLVNIEAEQALLGALLYDNSVRHDVETLRPEHFFEGLHGRLFSESVRSIDAGHLADPILLDARLKEDPGYIDAGGVRYLADLINHAPPAPYARDYAREIQELATSRELLRVSGEIAVAARDRSIPAREKIEEAEAQLFALAERGQIEKGPRVFAEPIAAALESASEAYRRDGGLSGLSTGLTDVDRKLGGLQPSDLIVLAARPSMGKTALGLDIAVHAAKAGDPAAFFSLEMSAEQLAMRRLAQVADVSSDLIRKGDINEFEYRRLREAAELMNHYPLHIDDTGGISITKLVARARRLKRKYGIKLLVVDYLQLITTEVSRRGDNRVQEVTQITGALKALAKELGIPVLALAQLSRKVEERDDKRPHLADLRESGSIEQDADVVAFLYRESYYVGRSEPKQTDVKFKAWEEQMENCRFDAEFIIGKQRHGPIGTVRLHFNEKLTKFSDRAREDRLPEQNGRFTYGGARD